VLRRLSIAMPAQQVPRFLTAVQATFRVTPSGVAGRLCLADTRFRLAPGDLLLLYTDGACEGRPASGSPERREPVFDEAALARTLAETRGLDAAAATGYIAESLAARYDGWASDDTALLALRVPTA
jgi:hypothetical protein